MNDCAHWYNRDLIDEEIAAKDREIRAAYQRTAALKVKLRSIRELTEGIQPLNTLPDAFEYQRLQAMRHNQALGCSSYGGNGGLSLFADLFCSVWPRQW